MEPVKVSRKFASDFEIVAEFYKCQKYETEQMRDAARNDLANAEISFALMADEILKIRRAA